MTTDTNKSSINADFNKAANAAIAAQKKGDSLWGCLAKFASGFNAGTDRDAAEATFKKTELEFAIENPKAPSLKTIGVYRSNKSVILAAIEAGVPLVDDTGKVRGKTEVEKAIKESKGEKLPIDKFQTVMKSANDISEKLLTEDELRTALVLVEAMRKKMLETYSMVAKKVA